jgi:predicted component of type VI protein secretion system
MSSARFELPDGSTIAVRDGLTIGRVAPCDLVVDDEKVSRKHARVVVQAGVAEIEDLGSRNGVFLNGHRVLRRLLRDGDVLRIGRVDLRFVAAGSAAGPAPAAGEDLLAGEDLPGADARVAVGGGAPAASEDLLAEAEPAAARRPRVPPPPPPPSPAPRGEVELLEFVDEVVEVRKPAPTAERPAAAGPARATALRAERAGGVLQFSKKPEAGVFDEDLGQLGGLRRALVVLGGIALMAAAAWAAMQFAA